MQLFLSNSPDRYVSIFNCSKSLFKLAKSFSNKSINSSSKSSFNMSSVSTLVSIFVFNLVIFSIVFFKVEASFIISSACSLSFQKFGLLIIFNNS